MRILEQLNKVVWLTVLVKNCSIGHFLIRMGDSKTMMTQF